MTLAGLQPDLLRGAIKALLASPSYDALAIIVGSSGLGMPELMAGAIEDCLPLSDKPVLAYVSPHAPEVGALLTQRGVPAFAAAESCTAALGGHAAGEPMAGAAPRSRPRLRAWRCDDLPAGSLDEAQAKQLFARFGVPCAREIVVHDAERSGARRARTGRTRRAEDPLRRDHAQERCRRRGRQPDAGTGRRAPRRDGGRGRSERPACAPSASWCRRW